MSGSVWRDENRAWWDARVAAHAASELYDLDSLVAGRDDLRPWEPHDVGDVAGRDLIHLQCHLGTDTVGWARRGARTVGLDFSAPALAVAHDIGARCGVDIDWIESDVYDAVTAVGDRRFDVVYTGIGALGWLPDLARWATVVRDLLRPGGTLYLYEIHPMWVALAADGRTLGHEDALGATFQRWDDHDWGSYAAPEARFDATATWERTHAIGEVLTAVLDADLTVDLYAEHDVTPAPTPWLELGADRLYHFADGHPHFPVTYSLRARRSITA